MKLVDYGPGFITTSSISRIYIKEVSNGYGASPTYFLLVETLDGKNYKYFEGSRESCRKAMLDLVTKLGSDVVYPGQQ